MPHTDRGAGVRLHRSLRLRVTLATALAFVGLGVLVCVILPRAYAEQVRESLRERTQILTHGIAFLLQREALRAPPGTPAPGHLGRVAGWLDAEPDFESAILLDSDGATISGWPDGQADWSVEIPPFATVVQGRDHFVGIAPVAGPAGVAAVAVRTSTARMAGDLENMRWLFGAIFLSACLAFWVLSNYLVTAIVDPLEEIRLAAMCLADGERVVDVPVSGDREIDELGRCLDMLGQKRRESTLMTSPLLSYLRAKSPVSKAPKRKDTESSVDPGGGGKT